jgi:hypothetical protein
VCILSANFIFIVMSIVSHALKLLWLSHTTALSSSTLDRILMLYFALIRYKLEYASVAWNSVTITDSNKLERIQRQFAALCHNRLSQDVKYHYGNLSERLNLLTLHKRRRHFDALFLINVFSGTKCCPSLLETDGLRIPTRNICNFDMFTCSSSHCPSTVNAVCTLTDIFRKSFEC